MKRKTFLRRETPTALECSLPWLRVILLSIGLMLAMRSGLLRAETGLQTPAAVASTADGSASVKITRDARGRKVQHVDFSDALIEGKARTPDGFVIQSRGNGKFKSLIELRSHFREKMKVQALENGASAFVKE